MRCTGTKTQKHKRNNIARYTKVWGREGSVHPLQCPLQRSAIGRFLCRYRHGRPTIALCWHNGGPIVSEYVNKLQITRTIGWYCCHTNHLVPLQCLQLWAVLTTADLVALNSGYTKNCGCQKTDASYSIRTTSPAITHYTLIHLTWQAWSLTRRRRGIYCASTTAIPALSAGKLPQIKLVGSGSVR